MPCQSQCALDVWQSFAIDKHTYLKIASTLKWWHLKEVSSISRYIIGTDLNRLIKFSTSVGLLRMAEFYKRQEPDKWSHMDKISHAIFDRPDKILQGGQTLPHTFYKVGKIYQLFTICPPCQKQHLRLCPWKILSCIHTRHFHRVRFKSKVYLYSESVTSAY